MEVKHTLLSITKIHIYRDIVVVQLCNSQGFDYINGFQTVMFYSEDYESICSTDFCFEDNTATLEKY